MAVPQTNGENHHGHTSGVLAYVHRSVDRVAPPSSRQKAFDDVSAFAKGRPILFVRGVLPVSRSPPCSFPPFARPFYGMGLRLCSSEAPRNCPDC
jgi:hypothetical protein